MFHLVQLCNDGLNDVFHLFLLCFQLLGVSVGVLLQPGDLLIDHLNYGK